MENENFKTMQQIAIESKLLDEKLQKSNEEGKILYIIGIYDKKAEQYVNIGTVDNKAFAVRGFMDACKEENSPFHKYPEDFKQVVLGLVNQKTGHLFNQPVKETLIEASSIVMREEKKK